MNIILDSSTAPDMTDITESIAADARGQWLTLTAYIEQTFGAKPQIAFSSCSAKPGWNVKYKKSGKALCTLYPEPGSFTALVVTGASDMEKFMLTRALFSDALKELFDRTQLFNNTKWLMISVKDDAGLNDVKKLLELKMAK